MTRTRHAAPLVPGGTDELIALTGVSPREALAAARSLLATGPGPREASIAHQAAAIVLHILDSHPDAGFAPKVGTPERAKFYQWLIFLTNSLQEELMIWQYPDRLTGAEAAATEIVRRGAEGRAGAYLDVIEQHLAHGIRSPLTALLI